MTTPMDQLEQARKSGESLLASVEAVAGTIPDGDDVAELRIAAAAIAQVARDAIKGALQLVAQSMAAEEARANLEGIATATLELNDKILDELGKVTASAETAIGLVDPTMKKTKH